MPRNNVPLYVVMPPKERARVVAFARRVGRPMSWIVRDALRVYLDAVEADPAQLAALRAPPLGPVGQTYQPPTGRPPKQKGANVR